jgi:hypothetical protein
VSPIYTVVLLTFAFLAAAWLASSWLLRRREQQSLTTIDSSGGEGGFVQDPS